MFETLVVGPMTGARDDPLLCHAALVARVTGVKQVCVASSSGELPADDLQALFPGCAVRRAAVPDASALVGLVEADAGAVLLVPSSAAYLAGRVDRPVWVVPPGAQARLRGLLVATDFSSGAETAYLIAAAIAQGAHARDCRVLHVYGLTGDDQACADCARLARSGEAAATARFVREHPIPGVAVIPVARESQSVEEAVEAVASATDVDLIVMGRRGWNRLRTALLGSHTDEVLRHCARPVLVVPGAPHL